MFSLWTAEEKGWRVAKPMFTLGETDSIAQAQLGGTIQKSASSNSSSPFLSCFHPLLFPKKFL
jgi:hypothetical protein